MSDRPPRPEPSAGQRPRSRPGTESTPAGDGLSTRRLAIAAIVVAAVALGLAAWRVVIPTSSSSNDSCQTAAWNTTPNARDLPPGWTISASQYDILRKSMTLVGATPSDESSAQAVVYATITCYPSGAADSVTRSADAANAAGQVVSARTDLGDQAFSATDPSGAEFLQLRKGDIVVYLAASGDADATDVDVLASAFDKALGGDGGQRPVGTPDAGSGAPGASDEGAVPSDSVDASASPAAPELEAKLPSKVGDVTLSVDSVTGESVLTDDQGGRPIVAALRADGATPADLKLAQAFDEAGNSDLLISAISVAKLDAPALKQFVLDSWLNATGNGIKREAASVGGRDVTRIDYGDNGVVDYVLPASGVVYVVSTADKDLAAKALRTLP